MCLLKDFVSVLSLATPFKVINNNGDILIYGRCYRGADRDNTFKVFSIDELFEKYGDYVVIFSNIRERILYIDIAKE